MFLPIDRQSPRIASSKNDDFADTREERDYDWSKEHLLPNGILCYKLVLHNYKRGSYEEELQGNKKVFEIIRTMYPHKK
jgi:hypothetical protein